jgi:hypothetical protein
MIPYEIAASKLIDAPAKKIYDILADYRHGHPLVLPKPYFVSLQVEQGGVGAGTIVRFQMKVLGRVQDFRAAISEPEPDRVLVETNDGTGVVTKFIVDPRNSGKSAFVTIVTTTPVRDGWAGKVEGWMTKQLLYPIYVKELEQLAQVAAR